MDNRKRIILILASVGTFIEALDISVINLAIPSIQENLHITSKTAQWLQTLYVLFFGGFLIIGGKLSDQLGRKRMFLFGGFIFMITSLGAGCTASFNVLAIFRALQGLGAAFVMPSAISIINNTFTGEWERKRAMGVFSSFAAIGSGSGLSIGGIISTYLSWHWIFLINVPILFITIIATYYYIPKDKINEGMTRIDIGSGILIVLGLLSLTYGVHELIHIKEDFITIVVSLLFPIILLKWTFNRLKSKDYPLISLQIFRHKSLDISIIVFSFLGAFFIGFLFLISLMLQKDMHYDAASSGLMLVPFSIMSVLVSKYILPPISKRLNSIFLGLLGWTFMLIGALLLLISILIGHPLLLVLLSAACISGIGITFSFTALSVMGVQDIESSDYGLASSLSSTSYFLGAGLGLSFITLIGQILYSKHTVGISSIIIMICYAISALGILFYSRLKITNNT